jgi:hypothetical protein
VLSRRRNPYHRDRRQRGQNDRLAERPRDVGPEQLRRRVVEVEIEVHEAAGPEYEEPRADEQAGVDALHQQWHQRDHQ